MDRFEYPAEPRHWLNLEWPLTIVKDRYGGVYSGGKWTAWPCETYNVPDDHDSGDPDCAEFWGVNARSPIGRGETPEEAVSNLVARMIHERTLFEAKQKGT